MAMSSRIAGLLLAPALLGFGCSPYQRTAATMDKMARLEAEFGTMGISSPVLAPPSEQFAFNLDKDANNYFQDAQASRQGTISELQQDILSTGAGLSAMFNPAAGMAFQAQVQQFNDATANNRAAQSFANLKSGMQNQAAYTQYQADLQAASALADPDKTKAIATAQQKLATSLVGPTASATPPTFPTPPTLTGPTNDIVSRPDELLKQLANGGSFSGFQGLRSNTPPLGINDRTAILSAAGDNATAAMFKLLGDPKLAEDFKDKKVLFGVCTVSVQPGWRTKKGYAADVSMHLTYKYVRARPSVVEQYINDPRIPVTLRESIRSHGHKQIAGIALYEADSSMTNRPLFGYGPHVAVISPLTDTQTLDLQASDRKERDISLSLNIAAQLAAAGLGGQAQTFLKHVESLQQDIATISPDVVVNSYSTGSIFGFQVGPRLRAIEEVRNGKVSKSAEVLDRQSFPALVIVGIEHEAAYPQAVWNDQSAEYDLYEPMLILQSANRWLKIETADDIGATPELAESQLLNLSRDLNNDSAQLGITHGGSSGDGSVGAEIEAFRAAKAALDQLTTTVRRAQKEVEDDLQLIKNDAGPTNSALMQKLQDRLAQHRHVVETAAAAQRKALHDYADTRAALASAFERPGAPEKIDRSGISDETLDLMAVRIENLKTQLFGGQSNTFLPVQVLHLGGTPVVAAISTSVVPAGEKVTVALMGSDLNDVDLNRIALISGDVASEDLASIPPFQARVQNGAILLTFTPAATAVPPPSVAIQNNLNAAKANMDAALGELELEGTAISSGETSLDQALGKLKKNETLRSLAEPRNVAVQSLVGMLNAAAKADAVQVGWELIKNNAFDDARSAQFADMKARLDSIKKLGEPIDDDVEKVRQALDGVVTNRPGTGGNVDRTTAKKIDDAMSRLLTDLNKVGDGTAFESARKSVDDQLAKTESALLDPKIVPPDGQNDALDKAVAQEKDFRKQVADAKPPAIPADLRELQGQIDQAYAQRFAGSHNSALQQRSSEQSTKLAKSNLDGARAFQSKIQKLARRGDQAGGANGSTDPNAAGVASLLAAADANVIAAEAAMSEAQFARDQTLVFSLPSKLDSRTLAYTPGIAVRGGDPSELVVAPQVIQLSTPSSGSNGSASGGGGGASGVHATPPTTNTVTVLIAGNNLGRVDVAKITSVPPTKQPLIARVVGNTIAVDLSVSASDGTIYFQLPLRDSMRRVVTPPVTIKPPPPTSSSPAQGSAPAALPTVTGIFPTSVSLSTKDGAAVEKTVTFCIMGTNLDQVDLGSLSVAEGNAIIDPAANKPTGSGTSIYVNIRIATAGAPVVIKLPVKNAKEQAVHSLPLIVDLQK